MLKKKNKKTVAILGTSPIMILIYFRLYKKYNVDVYEKSFIGGAWRIEQINNENYTTHNNVIVPLNSKEEKTIIEINKDLKKFNCTKYKPKGIYKIVSKYKPKNVFMHDLSNLYNQFKKEHKTLKKTKVDSVELKQKNIYINKNKYDLAFFPNYFNVKKIKIDDVNLWINPVRSISHHLTVSFNNFSFPEIDYSEDFDNIFDRGYFKKSGQIIFFTGRVRRKYKGIKNKELVKKSKVLCQLSKYISKIKLNKYHHYIIRDEKIEQLKSNTIKSNLHVVDTKQFTKSYALMRKIIKTYE